MFTIREAVICSSLIVAISMALWAATQSQGTIATPDDSRGDACVAQLALHAEHPWEASDTPSAMPSDQLAGTDDGPDELRLLSRIRQEIGSPLDAGNLFGGPSPATTGDSQQADVFHTAYVAETEREGSAEVNSESASESPLVAEPESTCRSAFRRAARELESVAADLEDIDSFDLADLLRTHAAEMRISARSLSPKAVQSD